MAIRGLPKRSFINAKAEQTRRDVEVDNAGESKMWSQRGHVKWTLSMPPSTKQSPTMTLKMLGYGLGT
jgi:hypothetical protein